VPETISFGALEVGTLAKENIHVQSSSGARFFIAHIDIPGKDITVQKRELGGNGFEISILLRVSRLGHVSRSITLSIGDPSHGDVTIPIQVDYYGLHPGG
jgi:hypothetical protein